VGTKANGRGGRSAAARQAAGAGAASAVALMVPAMILLVTSDVKGFSGSRSGAAAATAPRAAAG